MTNTFQARPNALQNFRPVEVALAGSALALMAVNLAWSLGADRAVAWQAFAPGVLVALALMGLGAIARARYPHSGLGTCAIGIGMFFAICLSVSVLVLLLLPLPSPLMDAYLISADAALGFDWDRFVRRATEFPLLSDALRLLYGSAIPQIALLIVLLGATGRERSMQRLLLSGSLCLVAAVAVWRFFPTIGPAAFSALSSDPDMQRMLYHSPREARILMDLVVSGPKIAVPGQLLGGLVAFPSIHMVMALMVAWYSRGTWASVPFSVSSLLMMPATILHGGHHLLDLAGGLVLFVVSAIAARRIVREPEAPESGSAGRGVAA